MTYEEACGTQHNLETLVDLASAKLRDIQGVSSGPLGLTPDAVKMTPEFKAANKAYIEAFSKLRQFNSMMNKTFKREIREARRRRRARGSE